MRRVLASLLAFGLGGCARDMALPGESSGPDGAVDAATCSMTVSQSANLKNKLDLLFMIDNTFSMGPMQTELKAKFPDLFKPFQDLADKGSKADLHIGVVTSDYGAGATGAPGCSRSPGGDGGRLQAIGSKAPASCKKPTNGNFVHYVFSPDPADATNNNLPEGQNLVDTFTCMASVGESGCGFEHPLESVYAALHNGLPENVGFLRDDAILAVVFFTNEDDGSAPPETDLFDKNKTALYGFENGYRQTRFGVVCGDPPALPPYGASNGVLRNCAPAPNWPTGTGPGKLYDVRRYIDFFTLPKAQGGVKEDPRDVVLVGINPPSEPFQVALSTPNGTLECFELNEQSNPTCLPTLVHSCVNVNHPEFYGDPAVRLNAVIDAVGKHSRSSICDESYAPISGAAAGQIISSVGLGCLPEALPAGAAPVRCITSANCAAGEACVGGGDLHCARVDCTVVDEAQNPDGTVRRTAIPPCPQQGPNPGPGPCWRVEPKDKCVGLSPDGAGVTVDRGPSVPSPHTTTEIACQC